MLIGPDQYNQFTEAQKKVLHEALGLIDPSNPFYILWTKLFGHSYNLEELHCAASVNTNLTAKLLEYDIPFDHDRTFYLAAIKGQKEVVAMFLALDEELDIEYTLLQAVWFDRVEVVALLLESNAAQEEIESLGRKAFKKALKYSRVDIVAMMLENPTIRNNFARVGVPMPDEFHGYFYGDISRRPEMLKLLFQHGLLRKEHLHYEDLRKEYLLDPSFYHYINDLRFGSYQAYHTLKEHVPLGVAQLILNYVPQAGAHIDIHGQSTLVSQFERAKLNARLEEEKSNKDLRADYICGGARPLKRLKSMFF
ncbi:MAG: hypothetical protein AB7I18_02225 [Candidatus Berkiella sp.]